MTIHECARCEGCGYVTGSFRWEIPWSRWSQGDDESSFLSAQVCPDCSGTGALIEMEVKELPDLKLPSRRGMARRNTYARHVASVLSGRARV